MPLSAKTVRAQLGLINPLLKSCSLETARKGQNKLGELMQARFHRQILVHTHAFANFEGAWILPKDQRREGVILYLHGGGYTCGDLEYAKGFATTLAHHCGMRVFCIGYRLAPEHPYPAALEDAQTAYEYLLRKGYSAGQIALCGESAGGGLCYSLCLKLKQCSLPLPGGIISISAWADLTASGSSYEENKDADPILTRKKLDFFTQCYTVDPKDPLVSPLLGDLAGLPPALLFVGGDEILRSDSQQLHEKLLHQGVQSQLVVQPQRWHGYLLFDLAEDLPDFDTLGRFLSRYIAPERKLRWMRLDNAAKIYPAARRQKWSSVFRLSATLTEEVDRRVLQSALDVTVRRFPSIAARLRRGVFWYYLQQLDRAPALHEESSYPLTPMSRREVRQCALRVIAYEKRIAVEFFHSLTDGTGGLIFLKTLVAEYLHQKHGLNIPSQKGVLGRLEAPTAQELEDSFLRHAGPVPARGREENAWHPAGTPEPDGFLNLTCFTLPVAQTLELAHRCGVSLTVFLASAVLMALQNLQASQIPDPRRRKNLKILLPVNLRLLFPSSTLRNFAMFITPGIDPRLGKYSFQEICNTIRHRMGLEITQKQMSRIIAANVASEQMMAVKLMPLFLKNIVMKAVFNAVGEKKNCLNLSNLGKIELPEVMAPYVSRMDFILGVQATTPYNCGVLSYGDNLYVNFIRNIREPDLEYHFHCVLRDLGLEVQVQSNRPEV